MNKTKILDPLSRGLALGTQAHGIGTAQAAIEGELQANRLFKFLFYFFTYNIIIYFIYIRNI
jgi:hypothetical protein